MTVTDWIPIVIAIVGAIGGIGAYINGRRTTLTAEATTMIKDAIKLKDMYKTELLVFEKKVEELNARVEVLEAEVAVLNNRNDVVVGDNIDLKDWADRLVHQVKSQGGTPVQLRQRASKA